MLAYRLLKAQTQPEFLLGAFLGIADQGQLEKVFARSLKAIEARNYEISAAAKA